MVDFDPSAEVSMIKQTVDEFIEREVDPLEAEHDDVLSPDFRRLGPDGRQTPEAVELMDRIRRRSGEAGIYGMHMPESVGGLDLSMTDVAQIEQHIYSHGLGLNRYMYEFSPGPHPSLLHLDEALTERYLAPLVAGEMSACLCITENSSGSDALDMETTAEKDGDEWVVDGEKTWITNGPYADFGQVFAVTDPDARGPRKVSAFLFDTDNPGFEVEGINQTLLNDGMQAQVRFDECRLPEDHLIGERGTGFLAMMDTINQGRARIGARCAGLMSYLLDQTVEYANQRTSWGKPIGERQHIRRMIANIATWKETTETLALRTAWLIDQGEDPAKQSAMTKYYGTEKLFEAADMAVQVFGGNGLTYDYPVQKVFRYARMLRIPEGTSEIQQETIADEVGL
jgi:alkylation response protein AidB-like acyl-CoA dehydrogenase